MSRIYTDFLKIDGTFPIGTSPLPMFRANEHHSHVQFVDGTPEKYKFQAGSSTGFRMLPYTTQNRYNRDRKPINLQTIIIENDFIKAVFLPTLGARLWSIFDKTSNKELLYQNPVLQPANLAIRNAWFSGGIEWNFGQYGHAFSTLEPINCSTVLDSSGKEFFRIYQYERCKKFIWQVDFHLPDNEKVLYATSTVYNMANEEIPMYYWTNIAVKQTQSSRVFAASPYALYFDTTAKTPRFGHTKLPNIPIFHSIDFSYPSKSPCAIEYFFDCENYENPWEAALEKDGSGLFDISTEKLKYRKLFCWGNTPGGLHWGQFLEGKSETGLLNQKNNTQNVNFLDQTYFEIQAGLAPTQLHGILMGANQNWTWTQCFGHLQARPEEVASEDWISANNHVANIISEKLNSISLEEKHKKFQHEASFEPHKMLLKAGNWGFLENERRKIFSEQEFPKSCKFYSDSSESTQIDIWLKLLKSQNIEDKDIPEIPTSFIVDKNWIQILNKNISNELSLKLTSFINYHLGNIYFENGNSQEAEVFWNKSIEHCKNAWAFRNLAQSSIRKNDISTAISFYQKALSTTEATLDFAISDEYMSFLVKNHFYKEAISFFHSLPKDWQTNDLILIEYGRANAELGNKEEAFKALEHNFTNIREAECPLTDIWFKFEKEQPPFCLDFRMK